MTFLLKNDLKYIGPNEDYMDWQDRTKHEKRKDAFYIFYESVLKPDHQLRQDAHDQCCYHELLEWRNEIIEYLDKRRNEEFNS